MIDENRLPQRPPDWVLNTANTGAKLVAWALWSFASESSPNPWPSIDALTLRTGTLDRAVQKGLANLRGIGAIRPEKRGPKGVTVWVLADDHGPLFQSRDPVQSDTPSNRTPRPIGRATPSSWTPDPVQSDTQRTKEETEKNKTESRTRARDLPAPVTPLPGLGSEILRCWLWLGELRAQIADELGVGPSPELPAHPDFGVEQDLGQCLRALASELGCDATGAGEAWRFAVEHVDAAKARRRASDLRWLDPLLRSSAVFHPEKVLERQRWAAENVSKAKAKAEGESFQAKLDAHYQAKGDTAAHREGRATTDEFARLRGDASERERQARLCAGDSSGEGPSFNGEPSGDGPGTTPAGTVEVSLSDLMARMSGSSRIMRGVH